ncbi:MAG: YihY/virulence factor BrkB family protein [Gammaproteobacteria bacterium]|nr:YihY/virulence factor BrkB family protein [Gammaproteobacteria bacterium]
MSHQPHHHYKLVIRHPLRFIWQVIRGFHSNQGLLLSGAVAYYALLSIIPLITLILMALSHVLEQQLLLQTLREHIEVVIPSRADAIVEQISIFLDHREVISWVLVGVLLFFSSMAFTVLENAISFIFFHRVRIHRRHFLVSAILPYIYILALGVGFLLMTLISGALDTIESNQLEMLGTHWSLSGLSGGVLYLLGLIGQILVLTSFYLVMPLGKLSIKHALVGGITAGILWELMRHLLVWYFSSLSFVSVVYGSLATAIVALISLEIAGMILLLGAQVIAEYERFGEKNTTPEPISADL